MRKAKFITLNFSRIIFIGFMLTGTLASNAQTWVEVGNNIYADKDSVTRTGEIAHITITDMSKVGVVLMKFDCKRNIAFYLGLEPRNTKDNKILLKTQELACRRSWELWK